MLFLIEYDRSAESLARIDEFTDAERDKANDARLERELALNQVGVVREVVLLEAQSLEALRTTHRRYFEGMQEFVTTSATSVAISGPYITKTVARKVSEK